MHAATRVTLFHSASVSSSSTPYIRGYTRHLVSIQSLTIYLITRPIMWAGLKVFSEWLTAAWHTSILRLTRHSNDNRNRYRHEVYSSLCFDSENDSLAQKTSYNYTGRHKLWNVFYPLHQEWERVQQQEVYIITFLACMINALRNYIILFKAY